MNTHPKRLVLQNHRVEIEEYPMPVAEREWVVVQVVVSPICGSDKKAYFSEQPVRTAGHEGCGIVVDARGSSLLKEGDRVILNPLSGCGACASCRSGNYIYCLNKPPFDTHFAEYLRIQDFLCTPLPEDISFEVGSLAGCALAPAFNATKRMRVSAFDTVLITGLGPVGMGALTVCKFLGARVVALDTVRFRRQMAERLGADVVLDASDPEIAPLVAEATADHPVGKAIDASGNPAAERLCLDVVAPAGSVAFIGENHGDVPVSPSRDFLRKGITLTGAWHYNLNDSAELLSMLRASPLAAELITDVFDFDEAQAAFDKFVGGQTCKVLLRM